MTYQKGFMPYVLVVVLSVFCLTGCLNKKKVPELEPEIEQKTEQKTEQETTDALLTEVPEKSVSDTLSPIFEGQDMEGKLISSDILSESELTMVNVWATYCNPCLREMPGLGELAGEYSREEFQIIGIISDVQEGGEPEQINLAAELIQKTGADYPHLLLNESLYRGLLADVNAVPTTFFINKKGEILETVVGSMEKAEWKEKIDGFLGK